MAFSSAFDTSDEDAAAAAALTPTPSSSATGDDLWQLSLVPDDLALPLHPEPLHRVPASRAGVAAATNSFVCSRCRGLRYDTMRCPAGGGVARPFCEACFQEARATQKNMLREAIAAEDEAAEALRRQLQQRAQRKSFFVSQRSPAAGITRATHIDHSVIHLPALLRACVLADADAARAVLDKAEYQRLANVEDVVADGPHRSRTPLILAAQKGSRAIVELLLSRHANAEANDLLGMTPLMHAAYEGHADVVDELLCAGAKVDRVAFCGYTALLLAANKGHCAVLRRLMAAKADVLARTPKGRNALVVASFNGHEDAVRLLLGHPGVESDTVDAEGYSPRDAALVMNHRRVVALLDSLGVK